MKERIWGYILLERMPFRPRQLLLKTCKAHGVNPVNVLGPSVTDENCAVRVEAWNAMRAKGYTLKEIATWFNRTTSDVHKYTGENAYRVRPILAERVAA